MEEEEISYREKLFHRGKPINKDGYITQYDNTGLLNIKKLKKLISKDKTIGNQFKRLLKLIMHIDTTADRETMETLEEYNNTFLDVIAVSRKRCFRKHGGIKYNKNIHKIIPDQIGLIIDHTMYNKLDWVGYGNKLMDVYFVYDELFGDVDNNYKQ